jgi:hypothetical protein
MEECCENELWNFKMEEMRKEIGQQMSRVILPKQKARKMEEREREMEF